MPDIESPIKSDKKSMRICGECKYWKDDTRTWNKRKVHRCFFGVNWLHGLKTGKNTKCFYNIQRNNFIDTKTV